MPHIHLAGLNNLFFIKGKRSCRAGVYLVLIVSMICLSPFGAYILAAEAPSDATAVTEPAPTSAATSEKPSEAPAIPEQPTEQVISPVQPVSPEAQPPIPAPIVSVEVTGNKQISTEEILAIITSKVGTPYAEEKVNSDRKAVLDLGWFRTVGVVREAVENGIRLVFQVVENPVISDIQFEGNKELPRNELLNVMKTKPGIVFNGRRLHADGIAIEQLYSSRGFILAQMLPLRMDENGVLTMPIAEGVIQAIKITGNTYTKTYVIQRYIRTKVGETYNDRKVAADVSRLTSLDYFETIRRDVEIGDQPGQVILVITVVEKRRTGLASVGGGYSSVQGLVGFVDLNKTNLRGKGQSVSIRGEFGGRHSYELGYRDPWIMTPQTMLNLGLYNRIVLREAFISPTPGESRTLLYNERRNGGNITLGRPLSDHTTVYTGVRIDNVKISGLTEDELKFLSGPAFEPRKVRSLTTALVNDTRDNPRNPLRGSFRQLSVEKAGLFGGVNFTKYTADNRAYFHVKKRNVIAIRFLAGLTSGDAPFLEQFLIGGTETLRGYRIDRFAGARMAILNTEYRFPLSQNLIGVVFADVGDAWGGTITQDSFFQSDASFTAHFGYGVGVRVQTPIGPIRLDLGFSKEGTETHFGVSHMF